MRYTRRKFLFKIDRKAKGEKHYGQCPKCKTWHKKGDLAFSRRSKRYCQSCCEILFMEHTTRYLGVDSNRKIAKQEVYR